jgi:hypothetical protein
MSNMCISEEGEYWFEIPLPGDRMLTIGTIANATAEETDCDFCDGWGYYLCVWETVNGQRESRVLAKMVSEAAAKQLWMLLQSHQSAS